MGQNWDTTFANEMMDHCRVLFSTDKVYSLTLHAPLRRCRCSGKGNPPARALDASVAKSSPDSEPLTLTPPCSHCPRLREYRPNDARNSNAQAVRPTALSTPRCQRPCTKDDGLRQGSRQAKRTDPRRMRTTVMVMAMAPVRTRKSGAKSGGTWKS
jgi:hypothetical protein